MRFKSLTSLPLMLTLLILIGVASRPYAQTQAPNPQTPVAVVRLEGKIDDYSRDMFFKHFKQAKATGAKTIIIDIDTYGGLVTAGLDISRFIKSQTDVQTITYVHDKAISAGAMIAIAANQIVMAPAAQIGDCAPISLRDDGSLQSMGDTERAKQESPILAEFFDSATRNGYDPLLVQAMVSMKLTVRWVQNPSGEKKFVDEAQFQALLKQNWIEVKDPVVPSPVDSDSTLLTVNGNAAYRLGLSKETHASIESLANARHYNVVASYGPGIGDKAIEWLNNPFIRMLLMMLFAQSLYAALHAPGHGLAEALGLIALSILIGVPLLTGYAQWWEIVVILIGVALLALEIFVIPGFGVAGILGILCVLVGLVMTFVGKEPAGPGFLPQLEGTWTSLRNGLAAVAAALVGSIFVSMWLRRHLTQIPYFKRLILTTTTGDVGPVTSASSYEFKPAIGAIGSTVSELKPGGSVSFVDPVTGNVKIFSVISDIGFVEPSTRVIVHDTSDNRIIVRRA